MDYCDENIREIESRGFVNAHFAGYGATVYKKDGIEIILDEWGFARIRLIDKKTIDLGDLSKEPIKNKLDNAINELSDL